jgi:hypothetical protein
MPHPTLLEWLFILGIDALVIFCAFSIGWFCWRKRRYVFAFLVPAPFATPIALGLWGLLATVDDPACSPEAWFCFSPVFVHWVAWLAGWVLAAIGFAVIGLAALVVTFAGRGLRALANHRTAVVA